MLELINDQLVFSFPEIHKDCKLRINFQRTLRIPDDDKTYPLPPGLGQFPMRHVDDFANKTPAAWKEHGGVMLPMYQSEALWVSFGYSDYPFAVKISAGKICAVTGEEFTNELHNDETEDQDYLVSGTQPWLDGFCVEKGKIRQFVAMPLGMGYTAEEQITGKAEFGGMQIVVYPLKKERFIQIHREQELRSVATGAFPAAASAPGNVQYSMSSPDECMMSYEDSDEEAGEMGLAAGGSMHQEIYDDPYGLDAWDLDQRDRCYVHLLNSLAWRAITGADAPTVPFTAQEYKKHNLPWFEYYDDKHSVVDGSDTLKQLKSVAELSKEKGEQVLPENKSVTPSNVKTIKGSKDQIRDGDTW